MNKILLFFLLAVIHSSSVFADDPKSAKQLSFTFNRFVQKDTLKFVECTLRNNTDSAFWMLAYDTTHTKGKVYIRPVFSVKEKRNGVWKLSDLGFSGVGLEGFSFAPGDEYIFETPDFDPTVEAIKLEIDIRIRIGEDKLRTTHELWTDEIKLP